jgi:hypothetical protein
MDRREQEPPPLGPGGAAWQALGAARERACFFLQRRLVWPVEDRAEALGTRGRIGVLGGGGVAVAAVAAALVLGLSGGSGSDPGTTAVAVVQHPSTPVATPAPTPKPKKVAPTKPAGPTLHGAPPDFAPAQNVKAGVGDAEAVEKAKKRKSLTPVEPARRGAAATASDDPAATAKIGATPRATAAAAQADSLATGEPAAGEQIDPGVTGPPAPMAAKQTARRFAQAFVVYEVGGVDGKVRKAFGQTSTKQLSKSLLRRPPRQPADVKVPQAKVVNVVAGPSKGTVYTVSVSLLRVGVTSELRLQLEQGPGKKWQVTDVLG